MIDIREALKLFVLRQLAVPAGPIAQGPVSHFEVRHVVTGAGDSLVSRVAVLGREVDADTLAEELCTVCEQDAEAFSGRAQTYWVYSYREGVSRPDSRRSVTVFMASSGEGGDLEASSPPTSPGIVSDAMRHAEVTTRIAVDASLALQKKNEKEFERQAKRIEKLEDERDKVSQQLTDLAKQYNEGQIRLMKEIREDRQHALIFRQLDMVAPALVGKLLPGAGQVGKAAKGGEALTDLLLSLSTIQKRSLLSIFGAPEQAFVLKELLDAAEAGKHASFEDEILRRLVGNIPKTELFAMFEEVMKLLRPEQAELFDKVMFPYLAEIDADAANMLKNDANGVKKETTT